jgi:hypothetical protein
MPNHIRNRIELEGKQEDIKKFFAKYSTKEEDGSVRLPDFKKVIPRPESLDITSGSDGMLGQQIIEGRTDGIITWDEARKRFYKNPIEKRLEIIELGIKYIKNKLEHGHTTWYDWSCEHWGTKWNSYNHSSGESYCEFDTAWSSVPLILEAMSKEFPELRMLYKWSDEDIGYNCGTALYENGLSFEDVPKDGSLKAYALAFELRPGLEEEFKLVNGEYVSIDD